MARRIALAIAALSLTALIAPGCASQPAASAGSASAPAAESSSAAAEMATTAEPAHDADELADAVACGHAMEVTGTAWRSEFRHANGDLDDAGYAAVELVLRDSWATILTGEPHSDVTIAATTVSDLARNGADLNAEDFQAATRALSEACAGIGILESLRALPGQGG
ncbi:hypothetical protein [Microbacterium sp. GXS0129]|uniref:hypothetical protein n=1 Tax=Microbacterium sp. GXS0129 TaxID=3377836 RepID=UPI00383BD8E3